MYDSITLYLDKSYLPGGATDFDRLLLPLLECITQDSKVGGRYWGNLGSIRIRVDPYSMKVSGSFPKWYLGDNLQTISRRQTKEAISALSDTLSLPMNRAKVVRFDTAANLVMKHPLDLYFARLGELCRYKRIPLPSGVEYRQHRRELSFYDKIAEMKTKRETIPDLYRYQHIIRYEARYLHDLPGLLKLPEIRGETLYNDTFYQAMVQRWKSGYNAIQKTIPNNESKPMKDRIKTPKDLEKYLAYKGLQNTGEAEIRGLIKELQNTKSIDKMQAQRMRTKLDEIKAGVELCDNSKGDELLTELDEAINAAAVINGIGGANKKG